ncbi:hypothetical protein FACS189413_02350 [Bacteroidia bacterium]|nr:hypothetical protein FACS189463_1650 [Bacteroidia bacterium]GHU67493.1 hypothetical protein FACS189413_02350 [Bacteroidia bacterium]
MGEALSAEQQDLRVFPDSTMRAIINFINQAKGYFAAYGETLTPAERGRKIEAGVRNIGFIEAGYASAKANPLFVSSYLP